MEKEDYQFYHIYLRGNHQQDFFYKRNDYINAINRLALAAYHTKTIIWALEYLSNHFHLVIETTNRSAFMHYYRMSLSQWYNHEYKVGGTVGKREYGWGYITHPSIDGGEDLKDAISYTLRNCKKHRIKEDFYNYQWSSIRVYFAEPKELQLISSKEASSFLPKRIDFPEIFKISKSGMILPQNYVNISGVEALFETKERFFSHLSMQTKRELRNIETGEKKCKPSADNAANQEQSFCIKEARRQVPVQDITISEFIIKELDKFSRENRLAPKTIPQMNFQEKISMCKLVRFFFPESSVSQLARILQIPKSTAQRHITAHPPHIFDPFQKKLR